MECDCAGLLDRGWFILQTLGASGAEVPIAEPNSSGDYCRRACVKNPHFFFHTKFFSSPQDYIVNCLWADTADKLQQCLAVSLKWQLMSKVHPSRTAEGRHSLPQICSVPGLRDFVSLTKEKYTWRVSPNAPISNITWMQSVHDLAEEEFRWRESGQWRTTCRPSHAYAFGKLPASSPQFSHGTGHVCR